MKINSRSLDYINPEKLYKQNELNVSKGKISPQQISKSGDRRPEKSVNVVTPTTDLLTENEIKTLQALFGYEQSSNNSFYGRNQVKSMQSGFLLDVKG